MRIKKVQAQKSTFSSSFASWLGTGKVESLEQEEESAVPEREVRRGGYIFNLCVAQLFRRQGIGRRLLCHVAATPGTCKGWTACRCTLSAPTRLQWSCTHRSVSG